MPENSIGMAMEGGKWIVKHLLLSTFHWLSDFQRGCDDLCAYLASELLDISL